MIFIDLGNYKYHYHFKTFLEILMKLMAFAIFRKGQSVYISEEILQ